MEIKTHTVVALHYELKEGSAEGSFVEKTDDNAPMVFIYGIGQMIPMFEQNLLGKKAGDNFAFGIPHLEAYGPIFDEAIVELPKETFNGNEDMIFLGNLVPMRGPEGEPVQGVIVHISDEAVRMDFNHPMAGKDLFFTGSIVSVREATADELDHGHVHGDGGVIH